MKDNLDLILQFDISVENLIRAIRVNWFYYIDKYIGDSNPLNCRSIKERIILAVLFQKECSMGELSTLTNIHFKHLHRYVNKLEAEGYVKRARLMSNKKVIIVSVTEKFNILFKEYQMKSLEAEENQLKKYLTQEEIIQSINNLKYLKDIFSKMSEDKIKFESTHLERLLREHYNEESESYDENRG